MVFFFTHSFMKYGDFSHHPGEGNRKKMDISMCVKNGIWQMQFQAISPFAVSVFTLSLWVPQIQMGFALRCWGSLCWAIPLPRARRCICHRSSCTEDRDGPGQRLAWDPLLINKHLCFPFALCNLIVKVSKKSRADIKKRLSNANKGRFIFLFRFLKGSFSVPFLYTMVFTIQECFHLMSEIAFCISWYLSITVK